MNKILVISYLNATSGQFLEYFLMKHDSVFNKGSVRITQFNGYDNLGRVPTQHRYHPSGEHERSLCLTLCITCIRDSDRCVDIEQ